MKSVTHLLDEHKGLTTLTKPNKLSVPFPVPGSKRCGSGVRWQFELFGLLPFVLPSGHFATLRQADYRYRNGSLP